MEIKQNTKKHTGEIEAGHKYSLYINLYVIYACAYFIRIYIYI